jgi:hypothetical protein
VFSQTCVYKKSTGAHRLPRHLVQVAAETGKREWATPPGAADPANFTFSRRWAKIASFDPKQHPHLDHGYAVTSHASQGQTADRVLIHIDTDLGAKDLLNNRMAYVSVSRGAHDAQIFTSDREKLPQALSRDVSHQSAYVPELKQVAPKQEQIAKAPEREVVPKQKAAAEPIEKVYSWAEHERHWAPLNNAVTPHETDQFAWKAETGTLQTYQHIETQRVLHIDGPTGQFYRQDGNPITAKEALDHAMPTGQVHSHSQDIAKDRGQDQNEQSIDQGYGLSL